MTRLTSGAQPEFYIRGGAAIHECTTCDGTNRETAEGPRLRKTTWQEQSWELRELIRENGLNESGC